MPSPRKNNTFFFATGAALLLLSLELLDAGMLLELPALEIVATLETAAALEIVAALDEMFAALEIVAVLDEMLVALEIAAALEMLLELRLLELLLFLSSLPPQPVNAMASVSPVTVNRFMRVILFARGYCSRLQGEAGYGRQYQQALLRRYEVML